MFLNLEHLSKFFPSRDGGGPVKAVDQVDLAINRGEFVTLLGPSGCGKTTTLRLIAGFEFPTTGTIALEGTQINDLPPNQRDMAMVFQSYALFPHLNVFENIAYGLKIKKLSGAQIREKVGNVLAMIELSGLENRQPNQLSGGQQQRIALARALVMEPKVLLFDEPLSNLDAKLRVTMRAEIRRIQQSLGITSIYVTHDQDEAMSLSDRIVVMFEGRIQQVGSAVEIYRRPSNRFVADFIGKANFIPVQVMAAEKGWASVRVLGANIQVAGPPDASFADGDNALLLMRPESVRIHRQQPADHVSVPATVRSLTYLGSVAEYELDLVEHLVAVTQFGPGAADLHAPGSQVFLELLPQNLYLLPAT